MVARVAARSNAPQPVGTRGQLALELGHTPALAEADFLVGDGNRLAHARIMAFPHWPDPITLLIGPAKSGKSHLARIFADLAGAQVLERDELEAVAARGGDDPLIFEDVDSGAYDEASLFHLLNQSMRDRRPLLLTAQTEVGQWPVKTDDVRSRARRAASFQISLTDDIQLSQMLVKLFADRQVSVEPKVIAYTVARMERSAEEAAILVDLMDRLALSDKTAITRTIAAQALKQRSALGHNGTNLQGDDDE